MGTATLGFAGGPAIAFRIDPDNIAWNFQILTNVTETIGGRVIQIIGSHLEDLTVVGSFGQDRSTRQGESWRQAEAFLGLIQKIMDFQASDANLQSMMHPPAVFTYPKKNWRFNVYVKDFSDADNPGTSVVLSPGKFNQRWQLTLFIVQDSSTKLVVAGESNGVVDQQAANAVAAYMKRLSEGIGWQFSQYTGLAGGSDQAADQAEALKLYPQLKSTAYYQSTAGGGGTGGTGGTGSLSISASASETQWMQQVLSAIGAPTGGANLQSMLSWGAHEKPPSQWNQWNNPLNTTQTMPGSHAVNNLGGGQGVQAYTSLSDGLNATVTTLNNGNYPDILANLKAGKGLQSGAGTGLSRWSGSGYTSA